MLVSYGASTYISFIYRCLLIACSAGALAFSGSSASSAVTLGACFDQFTRPEQLDARNEWYCGGCKAHVRATKTLEVWSLPDLLILHLKRFEAVNAYISDKIGTKVQFPLTGLDLTHHQLSSRSSGNGGSGGSGNGSAGAGSEPSAVYDCFAVVNHFGTVAFGHYTAFTNPQVARHGAGPASSSSSSSAVALQQTSSSSAGQWYELDDSSVSEATPDNVVSEAGYVLFYRRRK